MKKRIHWGSFLLATFVFLITGPVHGSPQAGSPGSPNVIHAIPPSITLQAYIEIDDVPVNDDLIIMVGLFDTAVGGIADTTVQVVATADQGVVTLSLPFSNPDFFDGLEKYIELQIDGETLTPRLRLDSTPFAVRSLVADSVSNQSVTAIATVTFGGLRAVFPFTLNNLEEIEVQAPGDGFYLVIATFGAGTAEGGPAQVWFGVSDDDADLPANAVQINWPTGLFTPGGDEVIYIPVTIHGVFPVAAEEEKTFYLLGDDWLDVDAVPDWVVERIQLTVLFVPGALPATPVAEMTNPEGIFTGDQR